MLIEKKDEFLFVRFTRWGAYLFVKYSADPTFRFFLVHAQTREKCNMPAYETRYFTMSRGTDLGSGFF
jgi:hypothetical protein